jgi:hypothetical protein
MDQFHLDIFSFFSIRPLANEIKCIKCYYPNQNLFDPSGTPRNFIDNCIHQGRYILYEKKLTDQRIICLDAVSLYPSARKILYCLEGIPKVL